MSEFNVYKSIWAQKKFCEEKDFPLFAPSVGVCYNCNKNIYEQHLWSYKDGRRVYLSKDNNNEKEAEIKTGISLEIASTELVTGCPHCGRTYCD